MGTIRRVLYLAFVLAFAAQLTACVGTAPTAAKKKPVPQNSSNSASNVNALDIAGTFDTTLYANADLSAGARLYDTWWSASDKTPSTGAPTTTHPIWALTGNKLKGADTWRCSSCHGWDYLGYLGVYGKFDSEFYTGTTGVVGTALAPVRLLDPAGIYQFIHSGIVHTSGLSHEFGKPPAGTNQDPTRAALSDTDIYNLTLFVVTMQDEASKNLSPRDLIAYDTGQASGDEARGKTVYNSAKADGGCADAACHGTDGRVIDFADKAPATLPNSFVDTVAMRDPWKTLHTIRFGVAGSAMLGLQSVTTVAQPQKAAVDALAFAQNGLISSKTGFDYRKYQHPETKTSYLAWDFAWGGRLYDQWWSASSLVPLPASPSATAVHALWPSTNPTLGPATFRCANCHGWDYAGVDGALGVTDLSKNPLYTGIKGFISPSSRVPLRQSPAEIYDFIHSGQVIKADDHAFASNLKEVDIYNLTRFIVMLREEALAKKAPADFIDATTGLVKNANQSYGQQSYSAPFEVGGCTEGCHNTDGRVPSLPGTTTKYLRDIARKRSQETLHKIRFGLPDLAGKMYGLTDYGYFMPEAATDILGYVQNGLNRNGIRGGRLYDNWMLEAGKAAPTKANPLLDLPQRPPLSGSDAWKCSACHGFDYRGAPNYGNNLLELKSIRTWTDSYIYDFLKNGRLFIDPVKHQQTVIHDFGPFLDDTDLWDMTAFISVQMIETRRYFSFTAATANAGAAIGKTDNGQSLYNGANNSVKLGQWVSSCTYCHGADGKLIPDGSKATKMDIFHVSWDDPRRFFHRVRFGMPGVFGTSPRMPGLLELDINYSNGAVKRLEHTDAADITAYAQKMMTPGLIR